ncbi:MAG: mannose-1-phosphate guanylyltransferase/mannose-6-phosphate isomerase [Pigmentiphaga sp.]|uniref:mannose-1-phosphate guanylyltransferase/mannose-6-phosphate isomerase n=1 Tax=Pigmentiphaga sp. TaxID=1977564 RepID=UPI0029ACE0E7|nr:mannose-1-phosphate guanylyltransferase/mannose-6-phosphate isomerase [Pigmentiphaga sp.]MDX3905543.1 mannose-1-phosphate guanylyltransferase/mannose-6-phosphate isomerase [Pigmentiphaga sp.]
MTDLLLPQFRAVILCGGSGSRLWPLSRETLPKQFICLNDSYSLLQNTLRRLTSANADNRPILVCNDSHRYVAAEQAHDIGVRSLELILEPCARNTAPAIAAAALRAMETDSDAVLLVMPSDHVLEDGEALRKAFAAAYIQAGNGAVVTFGVAPTAPQTGYGYIQAGEPVEGPEGARRIRRFVEKPSAELAKHLLDEGGYYWNSGMFAFRADVYLAELERHAPAMLAAVRNAIATGKGDHSLFQLDPASYAACPSDSIDYAVMEHAEDAVVIPLNCAWSDVGTWDSVWGIATKCADGNAVQGDVLMEDSRNCLVHATHRMVASIGLDDIVVIETADAILVMHKSKSQDIKGLVERFKVLHRTEIMHHRQVQRPWGWYDSVDRGERYQIKRITVKPGGRLSSQMHHHRAEHWVVVSGTARIYNGDKQYLLTENQSTFIPLGEVHSLENPGKIPLDIIEIQSGAYLGEDDIVRFQDVYGRV